MRWSVAKDFRPLFPLFHHLFNLFQRCHCFFTEQRQKLVLDFTPSRLRTLVASHTKEAGLSVHRPAELRLSAAIGDENVKRLAGVAAEVAPIDFLLFQNFDGLLSAVAHGGFEHALIFGVDVKQL